MVLFATMGLINEFVNRVLYLVGKSKEQSYKTGAIWKTLQECLISVITVMKLNISNVILLQTNFTKTIK